MKKLIAAFFTIYGTIALASPSYECTGTLSRIDGSGKVTILNSGTESLETYGMTTIAQAEESEKTEIQVRLFYGFNPNAQAKYQLIRFNRETFSWNILSESKRLYGDFYDETVVGNYHVALNCKTH